MDATLLFFLVLFFFFFFISQFVSQHSYSHVLITLSAWFWLSRQNQATLLAAGPPVRPAPPPRPRLTRAKAATCKRPDQKQEPLEGLLQPHRPVGLTTRRTADVPPLTPNRGGGVSHQDASNDSPEPPPPPPVPCGLQVPTTDLFHCSVVQS